MKRFIPTILGLAMSIVLAAQSRAQAPGSDHVTVPFSDPSRPGTVKVNLMTGGITVRAYAGKEVVVETKMHGEEKPREMPPEAKGMKRVPNLSTGLSVDEDNNVISIGTGLMNEGADITLQVPVRTNLKLKTINNGDIVVEGVQGEIEVNNLNGTVNLSQVSGSVVAHALNGKVKATLAGVEPNKPMSFSSLNGDIDVTFPPSLKASVVMKTDNGEIYSDFDLQLDQSTGKPQVQGAPGQSGKYQVKVDRTMRGVINGGGPEIQLKTFNGNIYIRRSGK